MQKVKHHCLCVKHHCLCEIAGKDGTTEHSSNPVWIESKETRFPVCENHFDVYKTDNSMSGWKVVKFSCPCNTGGGYGPHGGKETPLTSGVTSCDNHLQAYLSAGYKLVEEPSQESYACACKPYFGQGPHGGKDGFKLKCSPTALDTITICEKHLPIYKKGGWIPVDSISQEFEAVSKYKKCVCNYSTSFYGQCKGDMVVMFMHTGKKSDRHDVCDYHYQTQYKNSGWKIFTGERQFRTQKAKGIEALAVHTDSRVPAFEILDIKDLQKDSGKLKGLVGKFVRPCPMRPRHGFVDSRVVEDLAAAKKLVEETVSADPESEIVVMPPIKAEMSGIWTPGSLAIGKGTDGATAGTSAVTLPVLGIPFDKNEAPTLYKKAGIQNSPYLELLFEKEHRWDVQLRDGPELPQSTDYIPEEVVVKNVVVAEGDLLEWETKAKNFEPGTVVYHPNGSLASHYAVHAVLNHIPVLISREPKIGETLKKETESKEINLGELRAGFLMGATARISPEKAVDAMLAGLHHVSVWSGKFDVLLGFAMGAGYRLTVTASLGEARHAPNSGLNCGRQEVYDGCWNEVLSLNIRHKFRKAMTRFLTLDWPGGFGGKKWFEFSYLAAKLYNQLVAGQAKDALETFNKLVHAAHNGGWAFNKFASGEKMDVAAQSPVQVAMPVVSVLYETLTANNRAKLIKNFNKHRSLLIPKVAADYEKDPKSFVPPSQKIVKAQFKPGPGDTSVYVQWTTAKGKFNAKYVGCLPSTKEAAKALYHEETDKQKSLMGSAEKAYVPLTPTPENGKVLQYKNLFIDTEGESAWVV